MPNKLRYSRQTHSTRCASRIGCKRRKSRTCLMGMCPGLPQPITTLRPLSVYSERNRGAHRSSGFSLFRARGRAAVCAWHEIRQRCVALRGCVCVRNLSTIVERLMITSGEYGNSGKHETTSKNLLMGLRRPASPRPNGWQQTEAKE
jgi:hypothetical protein